MNPRYAPNGMGYGSRSCNCKMSGYKIFEFQKDQEIRYNPKWFLVTKNES